MKLTKRQKQDLDLIHKTKQSRTLLIYNVVDVCCNNKKEILEMLESELKELGVFKNE